MRIHGSLQLTPLLLALTLACSDDAPVTEDEGTGVTVGNETVATVGESGESSGDGDGDGDGDAGDGDGDACLDPCGDDCCVDDEICDLDTSMCVVDCGDDPVCGSDPGQCCADTEVCFAGGCIVPGDDCQPSTCATDTSSVCGIGEVCDPDLGACVPDLAGGDDVAVAIG